MTIAAGQSSAYYVMGFGPFGNDSLGRAVEDALESAPADTMVNTYVDRRLLCVPACGIPVFVRADTLVWGTLVKYKKEGVGARPLAKAEAEEAARKAAEKAKALEEEKEWNRRYPGHRPSERK